MNFNENWTKEDDNKLKDFHECDWEEKCTMCQNYNECEAQIKFENRDVYKVELWVLHNVVDTFETYDFETAKDKYKDWLESYDNNCNKGHTMFYMNGELMPIEWTHKNLC